MASTRRNAPIRSWEEGDTVVGFALLTRKDLRQDRNGRDYLDLELADASGSIVAKAWSDSRALTGDYDLHDYVAFKGSVSSYRDQLQVSVKDCRRVIEEDRERGFDEASLVPSTRESIDDLYRRLEEVLEREVGNPALARLARETMELHGAMLREHPAAKSIHHAYRGGLLEHVVSMAGLALGLCEHYPELDRGVLLVGVLFHDLGKIRELGAMPANDYTIEGRLVGHVAIGRDLLRERCAAIPDFPDDLQTHLEHLVLSHQGRLEFGSPVQPMTGEAMALHFIDDLDSKLAQLRRARETGPALQYFRSLGRFMLLEPTADRDPRPEESEEPTPEEPEEPTPEEPEEPAVEGEEDTEQPRLDL